MLDDKINEQNRSSYRPYYDQQDKCWRVSFPDRDAEEGDLLYVASEYARTGLYFPYHTMKALGGHGHDHYFEGVLEALLDDPEVFPSRDMKSITQSKRWRCWKPSSRN